jgi:hypothetical protein
VGNHATKKDQFGYKRKQKQMKMIIINSTISETDEKI